MHEFFHSQLLRAFREHLEGSGLRGFALERWLFAADASWDYESLCAIVVSYGCCGVEVDRILILGPSNEVVRGYFVVGGA